MTSRPSTRGMGKAVRDELDAKRDIKAVDKSLTDAFTAFKGTFKAK